MFRNKYFNADLTEDEQDWMITFPSEPAQLVPVHRDCTHDWSEYEGIYQKYKFCTLCDEKIHE